MVYCSKWCFVVYGLLIIMVICGVRSIIIMVICGVRSMIIMMVCSVKSTDNNGYVWS